MDIRIEKTKTAIHNAFLGLRSKKALEKITVKELCEKAKINKSTFYSHYNDIYDLSDQLEREVVLSVIAALQNPEGYIEDPEKLTRELFLGYRSRETIIRILFSGSRSGELVRKVDEALKKSLYELHPEYRSDARIDVLLSFIVYGSYYAYFENRSYGETALIDLISAASKATLDVLKNS